MGGLGPHHIHYARQCVELHFHLRPVQPRAGQLGPKDFSRLLEKGDTAQVCLFHVQYGHE
jgi:hypothetical protein